ncbi:DUF4232 domain-containing protein [Streptomyces glaucescens]|uniref:DUF4232 domain-containing protein n=1 Tax=Streptomyces glaucescens TaxID=1907 RepID=UPI00344F97F1
MDGPSAPSPSPSRPPSPPSRRPPSRRAALAAALSAWGLLTACDPGSAADPAASAVPPPSAARTSVVSVPPAATTSVAVSAPPAGAPSSATATSGAPSPSPRGARCRTAELRASVGREDPGAGQVNHPVVLTNVSARTCTVQGYPGAAFVDASGRQLGPDPRRGPESPARVVLAPGGSAWAGLSYARPEISGARTAVPAALLVTPPDERRPLRVPWTEGEVPVAGNESVVTLTALRPGSGT